METSHPRHSITETPALAAALESLRERLGADAPTLSELVVRGAEATLGELEAQERATFVDRLQEASQPELDEVHRIRHAVRTRDAGAARRQRVLATREPASGPGPPQAR